MIISKTPYRISFFGGGSDYPKWYDHFPGLVLSATINKYLYISIRELPNFFNHKYRIVWSKIENVKKINQIDHKVIKELLNFYKIKDGLEIHYDGDLPARSGMGSSSAFVVGSINAINMYNNINLSKYDLSKKSIEFEQDILKENVGSQDQMAATYGGVNRIDFYKKKIKIEKLNKNLNKLENNLVLIYTNINRTAHEIAGTFINKLLKEKKNYINEIINIAKEAEKSLNNGNLDDFGNLLGMSWTLKKNLSNKISNNKIDELYELAIKNGALGGKILGAGGGGFLLLYMKKKNKQRFLKKFKNIIEVPFKFSSKGSEIILNTQKI